MPLWDVTGTYVWDVLNGAYLHDFTITTQNLDGTFVGTAGYPAGGAPYIDPNETTETVTGQVVGNTITFTVIYQGPYAPNSTFTMTGTIDSNGHISGTNPWNWQLTGDTAGPINRSVVVVSGNTSAGENQPGWLFNRDTNTATPYTFNTALPSIGTGSLYVAPIGTNASDKFIAENFINAKIADVDSISYDFAIGSGGDTADKVHFYMNVYANFGVSDDNKFYDCRYSVVPTVGVVNGFTTVTFDPTQSYPVTTRGGVPGTASPYTCPSSPAAMDGLSSGSNIRVFALNVGDTSVNDQGLDGYLDNVVVRLDSGITTYDFEPNQIPVANAGVDQTITLPTNSTTLDGSASMDDGTITTYTWTQVSGPTAINPNDVVNPTITGLLEGTYMFQLVVTDNFGALSTLDTVSITVNPIPAPTNKDQCKNDGWKIFTNPSFKNQGQCVAFTNLLE